MVKNKEIVRRVTKMVIDRTVCRNEAAELLETSVRTIGNYTRKYLVKGATGLIDRRRGHYRKLTPEAEREIVECKKLNPTRSACWIQRRLKLEVSVETIRRVLVKHNLNGRNGLGRKPPEVTPSL